MLEADNQEIRKEIPPIRIVLSNLTTTRRSYARIIRGYARGQIPQDQAKTLTYMFNTYCQMFKIEKELSINERITNIENYLHGVAEGK